MRLSEPWPEGFTINKRSPYGWRIDPITGKRKFHHGVDVAAPTGTPLTAPADGVIVHKGSGASGGNTLIIKHAPDLFTVYYHLQKPSHLSKGTKVQRGDRVALVGSTGRSTGPHLHWEVRRSRTWGDTVDPVPFLEAEEPPAQEIEESEPAPVKVPKPVPVKPMSARLASFFAIRRALK